MTRPASVEGGGEGVLPAQLGSQCQPGAERGAMAQSEGDRIVAEMPGRRAVEDGPRVAGEREPPEATGIQLAQRMEPNGGERYGPPATGDRRPSCAELQLERPARSRAEPETAASGEPHAQVEARAEGGQRPEYARLERAPLGKGGAG